MKYFKNILRVLDGRLKKNFYIICFFNFIITILEVVGIGIFFPIIVIFIDKDRLYEFADSYIFFSFINDFKYETFLAISFCLLILFYIIKSIVIIFINYYKAKIFFKLIAELSLKVFKTYLNQNLSFYIKSNSSQITRNIIDHSNNYVHHALTGVFNVIFEILLIITILVFLFQINIAVSLIIFSLLFSFMVIFFLLNKKTFSKYGNSLNLRFTNRLKVIREMIDGIKEINLYNKANFYEKNFSEHNNKISSLTAALSLKDILPKNLIEPLAVLIIASIISYMVFDGYSTKEILPLLAIIGVAFMKISPSIGKILSSLQRIKQSEPYVKELNIIFDNYRNIETNKNVQFNLSNINFKDVSFSYDKELIFEKINFTIKKNTIFGIEGLSGSGKTTLINLLLGFLKPQSGEILVDNISIYQNLKKWQENIGYVPQKVFIADGTLEDNIAFGEEKENIDKDHINKVFVMSKLQKSFKNLNVRVGELGNKISAGQIQRIGIARALYMKPKLLILDEATNNLDIETEKEILNEIMELKKDLMIIIISHEKRIQKICDDFFNLNDLIYEKKNK